MTDQCSTEDHLLVSVCMIAYNQEDYLRQAVESVLSQRTEFAFELVIGDDCSSDRTREIALQYERAYPGSVRVLPSSAHLGLTRNFERTLKACRAEYVAFLDGDDFWTDSNKLQTQAEVLTSHPDVSVVTHPVRVFSESRGKESGLFPRWPRPQRTGIEEVLRGHYTHTSSIMVRNPRLSQLPWWFHEVYVHDWPFVVLCATRGDVYYVPEPMSIYRCTGKGAWSALSELEHAKLDMEACLTIDRGLGYQYSEILVPRALDFCYSLAVSYEKGGRIEDAKEQVGNYWRIAPILGCWRAKLRLVLGIRFPRAWRLIQLLRQR